MQKSTIADLGSATYSQEEGSLPRGKAWWFQIIASTKWTRRLVAILSSLFHKTKTPTCRYRVRSIIQSPYFHFEDTRIILFMESRKSMDQAFLGFEIISKLMLISGPCTKCIITHTGFSSKPMFLSNPLLLQPYTSDSFKAITIRSRPLCSERFPKPYSHKMLFINTEADSFHLSSAVLPHYPRRVRGLLISSLKRLIMLCSLSACPRQIWYV